MSRQEYEMLTDEIAKLRSAFLAAVPDAYGDHRFAEMIGSPWSVLQYVTEHFHHIATFQQENKMSDPNANFPKPYNEDWITLAAFAVVNNTGTNTEKLDVAKRLFRQVVSSYETSLNLLRLRVASLEKGDPGLAEQEVLTVIDYLLDLAIWESDVRLGEDSKFPHSKLMAAVATVQTWRFAQPPKATLTDRLRDAMQTCAAAVNYAFFRKTHIHIEREDMLKAKEIEKYLDETRVKKITTTPQGGPNAAE